MPHPVRLSPTRSSLILTGLLLPSLVFAQDIEEIVIIGVRDTSVLITEETLVAPPDTAGLLKKMPGANINKNGELTGIAQYRGMYGDRVNVSVNGGHVSSGGPNAMDAPLHYAPVAMLESLSVHRGIVPVSKGQETIGGSVEAITYSGDFGSSKDFEFNTRVYAGAQSVNTGNVGSGLITLANQNHILRASLMTENGDDSEFGGGEITPSEYTRDRYDLGYGFDKGKQQFSVDFGRNETGESGNAALPMDIKYIDSNLLRSQYQWQGRDVSLTFKVSVNDIDHEMSNFHLRRPPQGNMMVPGSMLYRQTNATSTNSGFLAQAQHDVENGLWRYGIDGHYANHDAIVTNPNAAAFEIVNFNDVSRNLTGFFLEREMALSDSVSFDAGLRVNQVEMDAGPVRAMLNPMNLDMGMPFMMNAMAGDLAAQFNAKDRATSETNIDWFTRINFSNDPDLIWYLGLARKMRSASYQERYLWLPMESTGGLADGNTYIGNIDLNPEVAHELEVGLDLSHKRSFIYPRLFYKKVEDYIQGTPSTNMPVNMFGQMMANMGMGNGKPLHFNNVDAHFYGFDMESTLALSTRFILRANLSVVRGLRDDIDDNLYRITPDNLILALDYEGNKWAASIETVAYMKQSNISQTNLEQKTAGYAVLNAFARIDLAQNLEIGLGINNILDRSYKDHLSGYNRAYNPDIEQRERLPGLGRNIYGRLIWNF